LSDIIDERRTTHGNFAHTAKTSEELRAALTVALRLNPVWDTGELPYEIYESLHMLCTKLARIANGDPLHADHWRDIAGYATLALEAAKREKGAT
jgi:hypothetical protein